MNIYSFVVWIPQYKNKFHDHANFLWNDSMTSFQFTIWTQISLVENIKNICVSITRKISWNHINLRDKFFKRFNFLFNLTQPLEFKHVLTLHGKTREKNSISTHDKGKVMIWKGFKSWHGIVKLKTIW